MEIEVFPFVEHSLFYLYYPLNFTSAHPVHSRNFLPMKLRENKTILLLVDPFKIMRFNHLKKLYFSFQPVLHDWCNKDRGMYYPVCGMMHIKDPLLLIGKSNICGGSGFPSFLKKFKVFIF